MNKKSTKLSLLLVLILLAISTGCMSITPSTFVPYLSVQNGNFSDIQAYLDDGGGIDRREAYASRDYTMLWFAASKGNLDAVKFLLEKGAYINSLGKELNSSMYNTPMAVAALNGYREVSQYLSDHGGEIIVQ